MEYTEAHSPKTGIVMIELLNKIRSQLIRKTFNRKYDYNNKTNGHVSSTTTVAECSLVYLVKNYIIF